MVFPKPITVPETEIHAPFLSKAGVRLFVRREDLNHPDISGNKFWKLKYNIAEAHRQGLANVLTFGGAYSNHIAATAAACRISGLNSIGVIRGEDADPENATLSKAANNGMQLHLISRSMYREKNSPSFLRHLSEKFGDFYLIPEGGTNMLAIAGVAEMLSSFQNYYDVLVLPVGTGGTLTGCLQALKGSRQVIGFSVLKGGFVAKEIELLHQQFGLTGFRNWKIEDNYHFGGYGKTNSELIEFIRHFEDVYKIPLDPVYTGKMMFGLFDMIKAGVFKAGLSIMALHTGGLQGRNPVSLPPSSNNHR